MENVSTVGVLMAPSISMDKDESGKVTDTTGYRRLIRSLLYLTASRPDIVFVVGVCARYQLAPKDAHLLVAKRIIKYLKGT